MKLSIRDVCIFGVLGALMYASKVIMEAFPNIHLIGVLIVAITVVYRKKALYAIYIFVLLTGIFGGFSLWWLPYLYIWLPLWGAAMLLPKNMSKKKSAVLYMIICAAHGFLYGTLYAPSQALLFGLSLDGMIAWIIAGLPFDCIHGISNFFCGLLIMPIVTALKTASKNYS